jgi:hypothetical protein
MTAPEQARSPVSAREILAGLECSRASCPCHLAARQGRGPTHCPVPGHGQSLGDRSPSLQVSEGARAPVWKCHAGCSSDAVAEALRQRGLYGATESTRAGNPPPARRKAEPATGVTLAQLAEAKRLDVDLLRGLGMHDVRHNGRPAVAIPYRDREGKVMFERLRVGLTGKRFLQPARTRVAPYGLDRLADARAAGRVLIVEGESDCWVCWSAGEPAYGLPGKGTWKAEFAADLDGIADVWVWQEPDAADLVDRVSGDVPNVRVLRPPAGIKDIADAHARGLHVPSVLAMLRDGAGSGETAAEGDEPNSTGSKKSQATESKKSQATELVDLTIELGAELWHDSAGEPWTTVEIRDHREHWPVKSTAVRRWLRGLYYDRHQRTPGAQAVQDALGVLEAHAVFRGTEHPVYVRVAELDGRVYVDLCDAAWTAVEVTAAGWQLVNPAPVHFRRSKGMLALPLPAAGGGLAELRRFVNVAGDPEWRLLVAWLLASWRARGPYPALVLRGEQGSAKSTTARILRDLIDPNVSPLRAEPKELGDLMIAATNGWCVALDNLSRLSTWLSDSLCRLATGGGFSKRELYTDGEEVLFDVMRPALLTGIEDVVTHGDLLDRVLTVDLPTIPEERRRPERDLWAEFTAARPRILGALLDGLAGALAEAPGVRLARLPRMADFAVHSVAVERALKWPEDSFMDAYTGNRAAARETTLEDSLIAPLIRACAAEGGFEGRASALLDWLNEQADEATRKRDGWPKKPNGLSGQLRRLAPDLRAAGWASVDRARSEHGSVIAIRKVGEEDRQDRQDRQPEFDMGAPADDHPPEPDDPPRPADDLSGTPAAEPEGPADDLSGAPAAEPEGPADDLSAAADDRPDDPGTAAEGPFRVPADGPDGADDGSPVLSGRTPYPRGVLCQRTGCRGLGWAWDDEAGGWRCGSCGTPLASGLEPSA